MAARVDPYKNFNFRVEIDGISVAGFSEVSGIGSEVEIIEYREGGDHVTRKLPGLRKFSNVTLKRGMTASRDLYNWHRALLQGTLQRRSAVIVLLDDERAEVARWQLRDAFPQKYEGPRLSAKNSEVAIETLVLCCEQVELD